MCSDSDTVTREVNVRGYAVEQLEVKLTRDEEWWRWGGSFAEGGGKSIMVGLDVECIGRVGEVVTGGRWQQG